MTELTVSAEMSPTSMVEKRFATPEVVGNVGVACGPAIGEKLSAHSSSTVSSLSVYPCFAASNLRTFAAAGAGASDPPNCRCVERCLRRSS